MKIQKAPLFSCVVTALLCLGYAQIGVRPKKDVTLKQTTDDKFRVGDVWEYQTRKGEDRSRITILRVDDSPELGIIVHIGVDNIHFANCRGGPEPDAVPHMPFSGKHLMRALRRNSRRASRCLLTRMGTKNGGMSIRRNTLACTQ